jgi:hypothetical protein
MNNDSSFFGRSAFYIPLLIVVVTLIGATFRDIATIQAQKAVLIQENARLAAQLDAVGKQAEFVSKLKKDFEPITQTDPAVARIFTELFPPPEQAAAKKEDNPGQ